MGIPRMCRGMGELGRQVAIAAVACCAAVLGAAYRGTSGPPAATGTPPGTAAASTASEWPERLLRLNPYLFTSFWESRGRSPMDEIAL